MKCHRDKRGVINLEIDDMELWVLEIALGNAYAMDESLEEEEEKVLEKVFKRIDTFNRKEKG